MMAALLKSDRLLVLHETSSEYIKLHLRSANLPTDGNKQALYERYLGNWLENKEREAINAEAEKRYQEQKKVLAEEKRIQQLTDEEKDREFPKWKQCRDCQKWRALPHDLLPEKMPEHWVCSMNTFDTECNSCDKSEAGRPPSADERAATQHETTDVSVPSEEESKEKAEPGAGGTGGVDSLTSNDDNSTWVQCDDCNKWRALPQDTVVEDLPDKWTCALNTDSARDSCDKSEVDHHDFDHSDEEDDEEEVDEYGLTEEYKQEVLQKFKAYKAELHEKKRARAERDEELAKERTERMLRKQEDIFAAWARKLSKHEMAARKRVANRAEELRGRLPISTYPYEFDEAKACQQLLRDVHCGVDVNAEDGGGLTAIYHAHMNHYEGYVQLLLAAGAVDDELHLESDDYFMSLENPRRRKKVKDEWGLDKFL